MIPWGTLYSELLDGIPRESGDDPSPKTSSPATTSYSPRERG